MREVDRGFYQGREQSFIKHRFLATYLRDASYKTLQKRSPYFNYIDAFAGPWNIQDEKDLSDASFNQAIQVLNGVKESLSYSGHSGIKVRFCLCERDPARILELRSYASRHRDIELHVFEGEFEANLAKISSICHKGFTFCFIDPTGWNIDSEKIFKFLADLRGEFVINFMEEHVGRHSGFHGVADSFGRFLADPNWKVDFELLPSDWSNEKKILELFRSKVKSSRAASYVVDFPIWKPRVNRIKMRLLLGTNSSEGVRLFRDTQSKIERVEIETRASIRSEADGQGLLFDDEEISALEQNTTGVGCPAYKQLAAENILSILLSEGPKSYDEIATRTMEILPVRFTHLNQIMKDLKTKKSVAYDLPPRKRVPTKTTMITLGEAALERR